MSNRSFDLISDRSIWIAVIFALTAIWFFALRAAFNRAAVWREPRRRCPHGVSGGIAQNKCPYCNGDYTRKAEQEQLQRKRQRTAKELRDQEVARLARSLMPTLDELRSLKPMEFEDEVARMFRRLGYRVEQTPYVNDGGRDAILQKDGATFLLECKRYRGTVGRPEIQKFHSAVSVEKAVKGFFVTTGEFTPGAAAYARTLPIELANGEQLLKWMLDSKQGDQDDDTYLSACAECGELVRHSLRKPEEQFCVNGHSVAPALTMAEVLVGLGARPKCARCESPMRLKMSRRRRTRFWGCSRYPTCRSTRPFEPVSTAASGAPKERP